MDWTNRSPAKPFEAVPGVDTAVIWGTATVPSVPWDGRNIADGLNSVLPDVGETRLMKLIFPPASVMMSPNLDPAGAEYMSRLCLTTSVTVACRPSAQMRSADAA